MTDADEMANEIASAAASSREITDWEELNAKTPLLRGIYGNGFERPSPIQRKAILPIFNKRDIIAQAHPGRGKRRVFLSAPCK